MWVPQVLTLTPMLFNRHKKPLLGETGRRLGLQCHLYLKLPLDSMEAVERLGHEWLDEDEEGEV